MRVAVERKEVPATNHPIKYPPLLPNLVQWEKQRLLIGAVKLKGQCPSCEPIEAGVLFGAVYRVEGHKLGALVIEGKTKRVFELPNLPGHVLLQSKDRITAGDGVKSHEMEGKAAISNQTTAKVFELLNSVVSTASCERGLSCHNRLKTAYRNSLKTETLDNLLRIPVNELSLNKFDPKVVIDKWYFSE
uniref:phosphoribosylaminoimidazolesuccinocarboxamide synthase n=1 Tax=Timema tahoe TaxID=61484 RepID=A0A7R9NU22_9NEOP|nr:unnamed protein product [Timema tahoe]